MSSVQVPALTRGFKTMEFLRSSGPVTLEALATALSIPKASMLRILRTLQSLGYVTRTSQKKWQSTALILKNMPSSADLPRQAAPVMDKLLSETMQTIELFVPEGKGLLLIDRREPPVQGITVVARIGFRRDGPEYDCLLRLLTAFSDNAEIPEADAFQSRWHEKEPLSPEQIAGMVSSARQKKHDRDVYPNSHGVRRAAGAVFSPDGNLAGIISTAACGDIVRDENKFSELVKTTADASNELTRRIGGQK